MKKYSQALTILSNSHPGEPQDKFLFGELGISLMNAAAKINIDNDKAGALARLMGLEWGGDWAKFTDRPHVQLKTGLTTAQKRERYLATA